jgi:class 3 adenylate cyclase/cephalosporin-C deacetylase-like acetyl esterase
MRKLAAIMFTDIVGYTALMGRDELLAVKVLARNRNVQKPLIEKHNGELLKEMGDGILASFASAVEATVCALEIQANLRDDLDLNLRIGIHVGDVIVKDGDIFGEGVNVASRLEPLAEPGGIYISERVYDDLRNMPDIKTTCLGEHSLKNVDYLIKIYALRGDGLPEPAPENYAPIVATSSSNLLSPTKLILYVISIAIMAVIFWQRGIKRNAARQTLIPRVYELAESEQWYEAVRVAELAEEVVPADSMLIKVWPQISEYAKVESDPSGAMVFTRHHDALSQDWNFIGTTPIDSVRFPFGFNHLKFEKDGFITLNRVFLSNWISSSPFKLHKASDSNAGMGWIPGRSLVINLVGLTSLDAVSVNEFWLDENEVTNGEYKAFVDAGGYTMQKYWNEPFLLHGEELSWVAAMSRFVDQTGINGPSSWIAGVYPLGEDNYPVGGLSWYEAVAYSEFRGKILPTVAHWVRAARPSLSTPFVLSTSNFLNTKPRAVTESKSVGIFGNYDLAGNVREWVWNGDGAGNKYILGGGWDDQTYMFTDAYTQSAFDRSPTNGFRCAQYIEPEQNLQAILGDMKREYRDYFNEQPVDDEEFKLYRRLYDYDDLPLNAQVESIDSAATDWTVENISFDAAYNGERMLAYLYVPRKAVPPFQTVVFFPGSDAIFQSKIDPFYERFFGFLLRSGRAIMFPIYKGTYERQDNLKSDVPDESKFYRDHVIMWSQDLRRSIDYLENRNDIDSGKLAYYGISWGGLIGGIITAIEPRISLCVLYIGGLVFETTLPEVDLFNFLPRVKVPVLMLNGKNDHFFPYETSQLPMMHWLGTPDEDKQHFVYETGHYVPQVDLIKEITAWLNKYFGEPIPHSPHEKIARR